MDASKLRVTSGKGFLNRRAKRAALRKNRRKDDQENSCRRYLERLNCCFSQIRCLLLPQRLPESLADHLNTTSHEIVQNLVYSTKPCMVPEAC
ncbi:hypothetical protein M0804_013800 [Polistes exclamans]|nr:hypothetical protein M0804_013800 [Polistes exclamans]